MPLESTSDPDPPHDAVADALGISSEEFAQARHHPTIDALYRGLLAGDVEGPEFEAAVKLILVGEARAVEREFGPVW